MIFPVDSERYSAFEPLGPVGLSGNPNKGTLQLSQGQLINDRMFPNTPEVSLMIFLYVLEACLVNLELPKKLSICSDVLGELWLSRKF